MTDTGGLIVALPAADDPVNELSTEDQAHISMIWFGDAAALPADLVIGIRTAVAEMVAAAGPFEVAVCGVGVLGPDKASVLLVESQELVDIRNELCGNPDVQAAWLMAEKQFPWWMPHLTIGYDMPPLDRSSDSIAIDALGLWLGPEHERHSLGDMPDAEDYLLSSVCGIPVVNSPEDLPMAVQFADLHPHARWYVEKRAEAFGETVPAQWLSEAV